MGLLYSYLILYSEYDNLYGWHDMIYILEHNFQIIQEKQRFQKNPHNYAVKKTQLLKAKVSTHQYLF